jgi:hypothetical protein
MVEWTLCLPPVALFPCSTLPDMKIGFLDLERCDLPDGVAGAQTDPLGDGAVLTLSFGKLLLGAEGLVALCGRRRVRILFLEFVDFWHEGGDGGGDYGEHFFRE